MHNIFSREKIASESKILIIDDSRTNRLMLMEFCKSAGFQHIHEAHDGQAGLDLILNLKPDLVFMDMNMLNMDGLQLCLELQRRNLMDNMIIIMQTTVDTPEFKAQAFDAGITDFITKPLNAREVVSRAMAQLERLFLNRYLQSNYWRMHAELKEATVLQNILLPDENLMKDIKCNLGIDIAHYYHPANELAGDYLSVRKLPGNRIALISVDVSGHGITAALYAFSIHTLLEYIRIDNQKPGVVLEALNTKLHGLMAKGKFATIFLGVIDLDNQRLEYAAAASPPPILLTKEKISILNTRGYLLGAQETATYETQSVSFSKGDILFLYSDALIETASAGDYFMQEQEIAHMVSSNKSKDSSALIKTILTSFHMGYSKSPSDDLSMLVCKYTGITQRE